MKSPLHFLRVRTIRRHRGEAKAFQASGRWAEALTVWRKIIAVQPDNGQAWLQIGNMHGELREFGPAREAFERAMLSPAQRTAALSGVAGLHVRQADWNGALAAWERVLSDIVDQEGPSADDVIGRDLAPGMAGALVQIAICRFFTGHPPNARRDLAIAVALAPKVRDQADALVLRARLAAPGDVRAYATLVRGHRLHPRDYAITYELTRAAAVAGDHAQARQYAARLKEIDPASDSTTALLAALKL